MKIAAMTVCCVDIYDGQNKVLVGGNSVNFATQCKKSSIPYVSVIGGIGNDSHGILVREHLEKYNIDTSHIHTIEGSTASNRIYINSEGDRYFLPDSWKGGVYELFLLSEDDWTFAMEHDIIVVPANNPNFMSTLEKIGMKRKIVVDFLDSRDFDLFEDVIPKISIGFISGDKKMAERLKPLSESIDNPIVITLGAEGSITLLKGKEYYQEAVKVKNIIDSTGCGDSYQAAYTVSWFRYKDISLAMEQGSLAAAYTLTHLGGVE